MADLKEIPVATASTPMAGQSSALSMFTQVGSVALQAGEAVATKIGEEAGRKEADRISMEVNDFLSKEESTVEKYSEGQASRLRQLADQGKLSEGALLIEMEAKMRETSRKWGGLFGDAINRGFVKGAGVDPTGASVKAAIKAVDGSKSQMEVLQDTYGKANVQAANLLMVDSPELYPNISSAIAEVARQQSIIMKTDTELKSAEFDKLKGQERLKKVTTMFSDFLSTGDNAYTSAMYKVLGASKEGQKLDSATLLAQLEAAGGQMITQFETLVKENGKTLSSSDLSELNKVFEEKTKWLRSAAERIDTYADASKQKKFLEETVYFQSVGLSPETTILRASGGDAMVSQWLTIKDQGEEKKIEWFRNLGINPTSFKQGVQSLAYAAALRSGNVEEANRLRSIMENPPSDIDTPEGVDKYDNALSIGIISNTNLPAEQRIAELDRAGRYSQGAVIKLLENRGIWSDLVSSKEAQGVISTAFNGYLEKLLSDVNSTMVQSPVLVGDSRRESTKLSGRQRLSPEKVSTSKLVADGDAVFVRQEKRKPGATVKIDSPFRLELTQQAIDRIGKDNAEDLQAQLDRALPSNLTRVGKILDSVNNDQRRNLLSGSSVKTSQELATYLNGTFGRYGETQPQEAQQPEPPAQPDYTNLGDRLKSGESVEINGVQGIKRVE